MSSIIRDLYHCLFCFTTRQITNNTTKMYILFFSGLCQMPPLSPKSLTNSKTIPEIWTYCLHFGVVRYLSIYEYRVCFILPVCLFYLVVQTRRQGTLRGFILVFFKVFSAPDKASDPVPPSLPLPHLIQASFQSKVTSTQCKQTKNQ